MRQPDDLTGKRFGRLTVLSKSRVNDKGTWWLVECDCGTWKEIKTHTLRYKTRSCGCLLREAIQQPPGVAASSYVIRQYRRRAKLRGFPCTLTQEDFLRLMAQPCHYCGALPMNRQRPNHSNAGDFLYNGLDQIEPGKGYTLANLVPACPRCNRAKRDMSVYQFKAWVNAVYRHWVDKKTVGICNIFNEMCAYADESAMKMEKPV